jgi:hypothetical protein
MFTGICNALGHCAGNALGEAPLFLTQDPAKPTWSSAYGKVRAVKPLNDTHARTT